MKDQWRKFSGEHMNDILAQLETQAEKDGIQGFVCGSIITNSEGNVLLVKRATDDFMPGIVELPSGGVEDGESLLNGLKRETIEEVGFEVNEVVEYIDSFDYLSQSRKPKRQFNFVVSGSFTTGQAQLSDEHVEFYWVNPSSLENYNVSPETKNTLMKFWEK